MSIVSTTVVSDVTSGGIRQVRYRCTDSEGQTHDYGPVYTVDAAFDADAHKTIVAGKIGAALADQEADEVIG